MNKKLRILHIRLLWALTLACLALFAQIPMSSAIAYKTSNSLQGDKWEEWVNTDGSRVRNIYQSASSIQNRLLTDTREATDNAGLIQPNAVANPTDSADATVKQEAPNTNYGSSQDIRIQLYKDEFGKIWKTRIYLRFDLSGLPADGVTILSAKIYLYYYAGSGNGVYICSHYVSSNSWAENTITWNNMPSYSSTPTSEVALGLAPSWIAWDVTSDARQGYQNPGRLFSECFKAKNENSAPTVPKSSYKLFYSKEYSSNKPYLQITYRQRFAVLIAGGWNAASNWARYFNDLMFMFDCVTTRYGYNAANTYVLYADGNLPTAANCPDPANAVAHANVIDFSATTANLQTVFSTIASRTIPDAFVFVYSTDHGSNQPAGHTYVCLWQQQQVSETDFAGTNYLGRITNYDREAILMEQCFSGGFINSLANNRRVIMTACTAAQLSWACDTEGAYDEFVYHWTSAANWATPNGQTVNADTNADGRISMTEAFNYAVNHDSRTETPQWSDLGNLGASTFLDQ